MNSRNSLRRLSAHRLPAFVGLLGILGASLSGCAGSGGGTVNPPGDITGRAACQANAHASGRVRWTVLVYMNAANNLQRDSILNVGQMAKVGSDSNVNIVLQWKQANCADCGTPTFLGTRRYFIKQHSATEVQSIMNGDMSVLAGDRLPDPNSSGSVDMGDYRTLRDFVQWGASNYPADNLAVLIWDHGSGWQPTRAAGNRSRPPSTRAVSQDEEFVSEIETQQIPLALATPPQPIDMLILDCSLEQMVEVAYEVRNTARVMVGSEESPPEQGYPYDQWLNDLKASGKNPCDVGSSIVKDFVANYPTSSNITQSVLDLSKMDAVATALDGFANSLRVHVNDQAGVIQTARSSVQSYDYPDNKDLYNYADLIRTGGTASDLQQAAANLQTALTGSSGAVLVSSHGNIGQANSNGLAVYIPAPSQYLTSYNDLALAHATHWGTFLKGQAR